MIINSSPLVSVIALCYNHAQYVVECLESIRKQTYQSIELLIIDDCSKDNSIEVIKEWIAKHHVNCTFIPHAVNLGICKTLNEALSHIKGKFVAITSTDDVWLEDKLEQQIKVFQNSSPTTGIVYSDAFQIDHKSDLLEGMFIQSHRKFKKMPEGHLFSTLLEGNFIPAPTVLIKRSCYNTVGNYDEELCYEDYDMWLRIAQHYEFVFCPKACVKYRVLDNSLTRKKCQKLEIQKYESNIKISKKFLDQVGIKEKDRKNLKLMLTHCVFTLNCWGALDSTNHLKYMMKVNPSLGTAFLLFLHAAKVPITIQNKIVNFLRSTKRFLKSLFLKKNINHVS